ncbi:MAG: glycosyltransferase [Candidatus Binatia bacterium]
MIAYHFPPEGSAGSYRPLRFVRALSKQGWGTSVVTADSYGYERHDPELIKLVPNETQIIRVRPRRDPWQALQAWRGERSRKVFSEGPAEVAERVQTAHARPLRSAIRKAIQTVATCYYQPDFAKPWIGPAVNATADFCAAHRPHAIWASAGPVSSWIVAQRVSQCTGVPYVLDLRDPHGLSYYEADFKPPQWVKRRLRLAMHRLFKEAQSVIFLFDSVAESYCRILPGALDPKKIHIIPNGYEGPIEEFVAPNKTKLTILYTGTLGSYRYDTLLEALADLKNADAAKTDSLQLVFVGEGIDQLKKDAARLNIAEIVETRPPVSHAEIKRLEQQADVLLVLGRLPTIRGHELFAGAKIFSYLKARRPIFGVLPRDETRKILERVGVATIADASSPREIGQVLRQVLAIWSDGQLASLLPDRAACASYSAERQVADLIRALEGAPALEPFVPGSVEAPLSLRQETSNGSVAVGHALTLLKGDQS